MSALTPLLGAKQTSLCEYTGPLFGCKIRRLKSPPRDPSQRLLTIIEATDLGLASPNFAVPSFSSSSLPFSSASLYQFNSPSIPAWRVSFHLPAIPHSAASFDSDPAQDGRMAPPKDRSIQAPQPFGHHALNRGPQCHRTLAVQRDDLFGIKVQLRLLDCRLLAQKPVEFVLTTERYLLPMQKRTAAR